MPAGLRYDLLGIVIASPAGTIVERGAAITGWAQVRRGNIGETLDASVLRPAIRLDIHPLY